MFVEFFALHNFRNYDSLELELGPYRRIALIGPNAQGKSNFLEALYVLAFTTSFRTGQASSLIRWEQERALLRGRCRNERGDDFNLAFDTRKNGKRLVQFNHTYQKRLVDYIGHLKLVLFSQEDLNLIKGQPSRRRSFIDLLMVQVRPGYYATLHKYNRILRQRNACLRQLSFQKKVNASQLEELELWDLQLSVCAAQIIRLRSEVLEQIMRLIRKSHVSIAGLQEELTAEYRSSCGETDSEAIYTLLKQRRNKDIQRSQTSLGPHRDDIVFKLNGKELKQVGSQGQVRTAALAMKVAELNYVHQNFGEYPILLLDDVFSELDVQRQQLLVEQVSMPELQTFITTTHLETGVERLLMDTGLILHVRNGKVIKA